MAASALLPIALKSADAARYLGATTYRFKQLVASGHLKPLPLTGSYAVAEGTHRYKIGELSNKFIFNRFDLRDLLD